MTNELSVRGATLPGLLPDVEALDILDSIEVEVLDRITMVSRVPEPAERKVLQARRAKLTASLRPISQNLSEQDKAVAKISTMLYGFPSLANRAAPLIAAFTTHLMDLPLFAIEEACDAVIHRTIRLPDGKRPGPEWAPTSPVVHMEAEARAARYAQERRRIETVLETRRLIPPPMTDERRAEMAALFTGLADSMRMSDEEKRGKLVREREPRLKRINDENIIAAWRHEGYQPQRNAGGELITPALYRSIHQWPPIGAKKIDG